MATKPRETRGTSRPSIMNRPPTVSMVAIIGGMNVGKPKIGK